jgi:hypothetical protein
MPLHLKAEIGAEIDSQIWDIYRHRLGGGELRQLAKLFERSALLARLEHVLIPTLPSPRPGYSQELEITLAWIDKRPLAKLASNPRRVELGDAAIFFFDLLHIPQTNRYNCNGARALILQAKAAKETSQMAQPAVPVNPTRPRANTSTARELELLSKWEPFDLYKTSGSRDPIVRDISVAPRTFPPANGWYMATPKRRPRDAEEVAWKSPWMCAPAANGALCDVTIGNLLLAFLKGSTISGQKSALPKVGADFNFDPQYLLRPSGDDWGRLCIEILRLCPQNRLPRSLFGPRQRSAVGTIVIRSFPYVGGGNGFIDLVLWVRDLFFPRRMPVLLVALTTREG